MQVVKQTPILYLTTLLFILLIIGVMPFINIDVSINAAAVVRPVSGINQIRAAVQGRVVLAEVAENKSVFKGDLLYLIDTDGVNERILHLKNRISIIKSQMADADLAISLSLASLTSNYGSLQTEYYQQNYSAFCQSLEEARSSHQKATLEFNRQQRLFHERVIPAAEFENCQFELQKAGNNLKQIGESHRTQWQADLKKLKEDDAELKAQLSDIEIEKTKHSIYAPMSGTLQNVTGVYPGSMVFANQELCQISPDTTLLAIAYVRPNDIGLIVKEMNIKLRADAFNYNQWGMASGVVIEVPHDSKIVNNQLVYEVRCSLDRSYLQLRNGRIGKLKKGMTMQAQFFVANRTAWQLLFDKADDWLNPNTYQK